MKQTSVKMPIALPKIQIAGRTYYADERLRQLRNIKNPHDYIDFGDRYEIPVLLEIYERILESKKS